jgi:hypothetical protein
MWRSLAVLFALSMFVAPASHASTNSWGRHHAERQLAGDRLADGRDEPNVPEPTGALAFAVGLVTIRSVLRTRHRSRAN